MSVGGSKLLFFGAYSPQKGVTPRGFARIEHIPTIDPALSRLFKEIPKTDLHLHLSGSAPIQLIRRFLREQGWSAYRIFKETRLKNYYQDLDDFLVTYYKVPAQIKTPDHFKRATIAIIEEAARENVRYLEIRSSVLTKGGNTPEQIIDAIEAGIREGMAQVKQKSGKDIKAGFIVLAQRGGTPEQSLESAKLAVQYARRPASLICGFDLAGSELGHSVLKHKAALEYVKQHGLNLTVHAGETPMSENITGVDSIKAAMALGADRIGHAIQLLNDRFLLDEFIKKQIPVELCPWSNVQIKAIPRYSEHPMKQFLKRGLNASLNTDNRMMSKINQTQQLTQLYFHDVVRCWKQVKALSLNGVKAAFLSPFEKQQLLNRFTREFTILETRYRSVIERFFCKSCTHPQSRSMQEPA